MLQRLDGTLGIYSLITTNLSQPPAVDARLIQRFCGQTKEGKRGHGAVPLNSVVRSANSAHLFLSQIHTCLLSVGH